MVKSEGQQVLEEKMHGSDTDVQMKFTNFWDVSKEA